MTANPSVAVIHPGARVDKLTVPLKASPLEVAVDPPDAYAYDIVLADNADRQLGVEVARNYLTDSALVYRMRGDVFRELDLWAMHPAKEWLARRGVLPRVDGVVAVTETLAKKYSEQTGVADCYAAGIYKRPNEWRPVEHTDSELRCVTLTNANYWRKVAPLIAWADTVDAVLADAGGP